MLIFEREGQKQTLSEELCIEKGQTPCNINRRYFKGERHFVHWHR